MTTLATNKQALSENEILEKFEAGIVLSGAEVKSVKQGRIQLKGSYVVINSQDRPQLIGANIAAYRPAGNPKEGYHPDRSRHLLLHGQEIDYLRGKSQVAGLTILPLSVYTRGSLIKIEIGIARGRKRHDKREKLRKRETDRDIRRVLRGK